MGTLHYENEYRDEAARDDAHDQENLRAFEKQSALDRAIAYLGAVKVTPGWYAFFNAGRYYSVSAKGLERLSVIQEKRHRAVNPYGIWIQEVREKECFCLPIWWTPEQRFIVRGDGDYIYALCPSKDGATAGLSGEHGTMRVLTADLESGDEVML